MHSPESSSGSTPQGLAPGEFCEVEISTAEWQPLRTERKKAIADSYESFAQFYDPCHLGPLGDSVLVSAYNQVLERSILRQKAFKDWRSELPIASLAEQIAGQSISVSSPSIQELGIAAVELTGLPMKEWALEAENGWRPGIRYNYVLRVRNQEGDEIVRATLQKKVLEHTVNGQPYREKGDVFWNGSQYFGEIIRGEMEDKGFDVVVINAGQRDFPVAELDPGFAQELNEAILVKHPEWEDRIFKPCVSFPAILYDSFN